ncbi:MAG: hypothetical protein ACYTEQ_21580 [Planctomycetota bacterium]|jgi:hypothetical protein
MRTDPEAVRIKQTRRLILSSLNRLYPTPLQIETLFRVMCGFDENYDLELLKKDVTYLKQKGYLEYVDDKLGGAGSFRKKCIGLTAEGKEIADRTQTDDALEI